MRVVVLLSGGLDSSTTLAGTIREGHEAHALTVRYGQRNAIEVRRASEIARALRAASHRVVTVDLAFPGGSALTDTGIPIPRDRTGAEIGSGIPATYVPARNTVFLALALSWAETIRAREIRLGVNAVDYSGYPDCRPEFLRAFEEVARLGTRAGAEGTAIRVHAPLVGLAKADIVRRAVELGVDLACTSSCYEPDEEGMPCGRCDACRLRERGFREAGVEDPLRR